MSTFNHPTLDQLRVLKLIGMVDAFEEQLRQPLTDLDFESRLALLVDREVLVRDNRRLQRLLQQAKFPQAACIEDMAYTPGRGLTKAQVLSWSHMHWVPQHQNMILTGPTGCGKTYMACALGHSACLHGYSCRYYRLPRLGEQLKISKAEGKYVALLQTLAKIDLLILDDWGLISLEREHRQDLLEILDDRYQKRSTLVTSQLPIQHWHTYLDEATLADAILDRLWHNAIRVEITGESMRKQNNQDAVEQTIAAPKAITH